MIKYHCDVCSAEFGPGGTSYRVDRYQLALDLCPAHTKEFVTHMLKLLPKYRQGLVDNMLTRSLMDAVVGGQDQAFVQAKKEAQARGDGAPILPLSGIPEIHRLVNEFIRINKPI